MIKFNQQKHRLVYSINIFVKNIEIKSYTFDVNTFEGNHLRDAFE